MADSEPQHVCKTQHDFDADDARGIVVGLGPVVPRWVPNSALKYFVDTNSFSADTEADFAAQALKEAANEWNGHNFGVTIGRAESKATAHFVLRYDGSVDFQTDGVLAIAFFPGEPDKDRVVLVTQYALGSRKNRAMLKGVFLHELGHVYGLRHEFTLYDKKELEEHGLRTDEPDLGGQQFTEKNERSVMGYKFFPPTIQQTDIDGIKAFYQLPNGHKIGNPIKDFAPKLLK